MFSRVNILDEFVKEREKVSPEAVLQEAISLINSEHEKDEALLDRLINSSPARFPVSLSSKDVFSLTEIRNIAIRYRLRFLDSGLFKGDVPYEAISKLKEAERKYKVKFSEFKILAPASLFKLEDRNKDPLLFARVSEQEYLLIHKWGKDLSGFRRVLAFPLRTIRNFILTMLALSVLITLAVPVDYPARMFIFLLSNLFFLSMFAHIGYMRLNQNFSEFEWNSRFVN